MCLRNLFPQIMDLVLMLVAQRLQILLLRISELLLLFRKFFLDQFELIVLTFDDFLQVFNLLILV